MMSSSDTSSARVWKGLVSAALIAASAAAAYVAWSMGASVSTDDAYVQGDAVLITPQVNGTVLSIAADETDDVHAGQVVVRLDASDARLALDQAEAQLAQTVREVRTVFANNEALRAVAASREADVARFETDRARAQDDLDRRAPLIVDGAVGREEFEHGQAQLRGARSALAAAQSAARAAHAQLAANQALTDRTSVDRHPNVLRAAARVREALLALRRTELAAPVDGQVARRSVQVGQRVQAGTPLMTVVPLQTVWVDANFKESQLTRLRIGQPVRLHADMDGGLIGYQGRVAGLGAGTGAAFSLLPAQNATGNWIKVVQRVPVRIALDPAQVAAHPLRVGLSMQVSVDTADTRGSALAAIPRRDAPAQTDVFDGGEREADAIVRAIVAGNSQALPARPATHR